MVLVHPELLKEAAKMLQHTVGAGEREPRKLAKLLEEAAIGVQTDWPPKNYKPLP
jgi:hypothetical protein